MEIVNLFYKLIIRIRNFFQTHLLKLRNKIHKILPLIWITCPILKNIFEQIKCKLICNNSKIFPKLMMRLNPTIMKEVKIISQ